MPIIRRYQRTAVSRSKCNEAEFVGPVGVKFKSPGGACPITPVNGEEDFRRTLPAERLARSGVEFPGDLVGLLL